MVKSEAIKPKEKKKKREYPYLGIEKDSEIVVLFISDSCGTVVHAVTNSHTIGEFLEDWMESSFELYDGEIKLRNKE